MLLVTAESSTELGQVLSAMLALHAQAGGTQPAAERAVSRTCTEAVAVIQAFLGRVSGAACQSAETSGSSAVMSAT